MKIGMNLSLWTHSPNYISCERLVRQIKNWGFDGIELFPTAVTLAECKRFNLLCQELDLGITTVFSLNGKVSNPISDDANIRNKALDELKKAVDHTVALGANILTGPLYQGIVTFSGKGPTKEEWTRAVNIVKEVARYAKKANIKIALEPLNRYESYLINTINDGIKFLQDVDMDNVGLLADTYHSNIEEKRVTETWRRVINKIFHIHISENDRGTPGTGHAIPHDIFNMLIKEGYSGWLVIEAFSKNVTELIPSMHLWRSFALTDEEIAINGLKFIKEMLNNARL